MVVVGGEVSESGDCKGRIEDPLVGGFHIEQNNDGLSDDQVAASVVESDVREEVVKGLSELRVGLASENEGSSGGPSSIPGCGGGSCPPATSCSAAKACFPC